MSNADFTSTTSVPTASLSAGVDARALIESGAICGAGCVIQSGAVLASGTVLGLDVRVEHYAVFVAAEPSERPTTVGDRTQIGANAVIHAGLQLGIGCRVRPGAIVTRSVPPGAIVEGNPAVIIGYVDAVPQALRAAPVKLEDRTERVVRLPVRGVTVHNLPLHADLRGDLSVGEFQRDVPFAPQRYFIVWGVPNREVRGEHAHRKCHQFLVCVRGSCSVVADDGEHRAEVVLDGPQRGLYLPPLTWGIQYKHSVDAILLVFASDHYDSGDYIREYGQFLAEIGRR